MKIILADDIGSKAWFSDILICSNVDKEMGTKIVKLLNKDLNSREYAYILVEDNEKLYKSCIDE